MDGVQAIEVVPEFAGRISPATVAWRGANSQRGLVGTGLLLALGDEGEYPLRICSPLDTPQGLGRGYFVSGGLDAQ
jgi:hypothetical protein